MAFLDPEPPVLLGDPLWPVETRGEERPPARFLPGGLAHSSLVAGGAVVEGLVEHSILFGGAVVERGARVSNSILFQDARVESGAVLDRVILDKLVQVGKRAVLGDGPLPEEPRAAGLCVVGKEAKLPAGYRLPRGATVPVGADLAAGEAPDEAAEQRAAERLT
jgi:glucose-1-phosphate adenylyltransferase